MPTDNEIKALHRKYAKTDDDFRLVYRHCVIIEAIAVQLLAAKRIEGINTQLLHVGCMLHDIGAYDVLVEGAFDRGVRHGVIGAEILKDEGMPESIWRIASHHTGVGLTVQDVLTQQLPIPAADYMPQTDMERIITYSDKFHSKNSPIKGPAHFCSFDWYRNYLHEFGPEILKRFDLLATQFGKPDLEALNNRFKDKIKTI